MNYSGIAVLVLSVSVSLTLMAAVLSILLSGQTLTQAGATVISTMFGVIVGAIAGYLAKNGRRNGN